MQYTYRQENVAETKKKHTQAKIEHWLKNTSGIESEK